MTTLTPEFLVKLYKSLLRIRRSEEMLADEYRKGTMRTPTHFGIGQEAIAVGACAALQRSDVVYSHHRSHTHYLGKGGALLGLIAELLGREGGCSRGRGGSVHLVDVDSGFMGSSPILGHSLALATGSALAFKMDSKPQVAMAFFGEGACDEGSVWESLNFAAIKKLPVLFVCENNLYATESPMSVRMSPGTEICEKVRAFNIPSTKIDGNDVAAVYKATHGAVADCRAGGGPVFIECMTYRWREHVGPLWDYEVNRTYRNRDELNAWMEKCPVKRAGEVLLASEAASVGDLVQWLEEVDSEITKTIKQAYESPWPETSTLFENIY
jgi:TPP-dependent pyruvate/acetoin dehydrogenase alpha subunit